MLRPFLVPRVPKKDVRRLSVGVVAVAAAVESGTTAAAPVLAASVTGVVEVTGFSNCGAVEDTVEGSSLEGTTGAASVAAGLVASFLLNRPLKIEARLFGFGAVSRVVDAGVVSAVMDSVARGSALVFAAPAETPEAGMTGSPTTRDAVIG